MRPVSKAPPRVAVWVTLLELEKVTWLPSAILSVGGWKAKWLMFTLVALLAVAVAPAEAPVLWMPSSSRPKTSATTAVSCHPCRDFEPAIGPTYGATLALVQTPFIITTA